MECSRSFYEKFKTPRCFRAGIRPWTLALFFAGSVVSSVSMSAALGVEDGSYVRPSYTPSVSEEYFFGDPNAVYPNPYTESGPFVPADGPSNPVPNREVRTRARSERRENVRRFFAGPEHKKSKDASFSNSNDIPETLPAIELEPVSPPEMNGEAVITDALGPAPERWNPDGTTSALPIYETFPENGESGKDGTQDGRNGEEIVPSEDSSLILEEPDSELLLEDVSEEQLPELVPAKTPSKTQTTAVSAPRLHPVSYSSRVFHPEEGAKSQPSMKTDTKIETDARAEAVSEPKTDEGRAQTRSILETSESARHVDFAVQTVAYTYPTRKNFPLKKRTSDDAVSQSQTPTQPQTQSQTQTPYQPQTPPQTSYPAQAQTQYPQPMVQTYENREEKSENRNVHNLNNAAPVPFSAASPVPVRTTMEVPVPQNTVVPAVASKNYTSVSDSSAEPLQSNAEVAVYRPQFPDPNAPQLLLPNVLPPKTVFQDFGLRKTLETSTLPWFSTYIRDLDVNEEQLFNALRTMGNNIKMSQCRSGFSLMEASIIASHPKDAKEANLLINRYYNIEYYLLKATASIDARNDLSALEKEREKAESILNFMHRHVLLGGYQLENTTINNLLEMGRYNCVTATILYCCLAEKAGLNVTAVELPGHAMCWVYLSNGERIEIETTCRNWFQYRNDPAAQRQVICKLIREASPQLRDQTDEMLLLQIPQPISDKRLIAKIYYNRGVDLLSTDDFPGALEANAIAYILDPQSKTTHGNLLATMNNWAIALCKSGDYDSATGLLRLGIQYEPEYLPFKNNHIHVYHRWVDMLYRNGDFNEALRIASQAAHEQPNVAHFQKLRTQIEQSIAAVDTGTVRR